MSISFASSPGNLFNRIGKLGACIKNLGSFQATQLTALTDTTTGVVAQYNAEPDLQAICGSSYISILNGTGGILGSVMSNLAAQTFSRVTFRDNPQIGQTLQTQNTLASVLEVIRQMKIAGATVLLTPVSSTVNPFVGTGNGQIVISTLRPSDGKTCENAFSENLTFTCTSDSYSGGATAGNEPFTVTGAGAQSDYFAFNWPLGSGCSTGLSAIDGNSDATSGNLLTNSGFESWTAPNLNSWVRKNGVAGTDYYKETSILYDGSASLGLLGDGSTLTELWQNFNDSSGTTGQLQPLTQYSMCIWARRDGVAPATGVLTFDLISDGAVVIQDQNGANNTFAIDLTGLSTVFTPYYTSFRTPAILPSQSVFRMRLTTALEAGRNVYLDKLGMGVMTNLYLAGPYASVHAGSTPFLAGDYSISSILNSRGASGTLNTFQTLLARLLPSYILSTGITFPSSPTPTISDNALIV